MNPAPLNENLNEKGGTTKASWISWLQQLSNRMAISTNGSSANRPVFNLYVGLPYFDSTLGKPVYLSQVSPPLWVDATGAIV